jgi:hypothetical protein
MPTERTKRLARAIEALSSRDMIRLLDTSFADGEFAKYRLRIARRLLDFSEKTLAKAPGSERAA